MTPEDARSAYAENRARRRGEPLPQSEPNYVLVRAAVRSFLAGGSEFDSFVCPDDMRLVRVILRPFGFGVRHRPDGGLHRTRLSSTRAVSDGARDLARHWAHRAGLELDIPRRDGWHVLPPLVNETGSEAVLNGDQARRILAKIGGE